jgi:hypothetical protein
LVWDIKGQTQLRVFENKCMCVCEYLKQTEENCTTKSLIICTPHTYIIKMITSGTDLKQVKRYSWRVSTWTSGSRMWGYGLDQAGSG